ncbi:MAG: CRISPR-associated endoribonuclease Cas6 [Bacteroidota bacterium]|nr:CRISPR-associated endoribonuclease Cas6 [Bacteroidota bacterium]
MRLYFDLTPNTEPVPFDYQHFLIGALHKWLGLNKIHDDVSLYSLSWLFEGKIENDNLDFPNGSKWFISFFDIESAKLVLKNVLTEPEVCCGMKVKEVKIQDTPQFGTAYRFMVASPVLIRKYDGVGLKHLLYDNPETDALLTQTLKTKLGKAGMIADRVQVRFDRTYTKARTKLVTIKGIQNRASLCPIIVEGNQEVVSFAWDVGVGHSTGSGFGALC